MPNWCMNRLIIKGDSKELQKLIQDHKDAEVEIPHFDFVIPYPEEFKQKDKEYNDLLKIFEAEGRKDEFWKSGYKNGYNSGGYEWCINNWGTKWECAEAQLDDFEDNLAINFETAWAPPEPVIEAYSKKYPLLTFRLEYLEPGMGFRGIHEIGDGGKWIEVWSEHYDSAYDKDENPEEDDWPC